jgi:hypothetical protein
MVKAATWLLCTYVTFKLVQLVFGSRPRSPDHNPGFRDTLLRGEPLLFGIAFALSVPAALGSDWYLHRGYTRSFARSADCYGRLMALDALPAVRGRFDPYKVYQTIEGAEGSAALVAQSLDMGPALVRTALADRMRFYAKLYPGLARQADRRTIEREADAVRNCLTQPLMNF